MMDEVARHRFTRGELATPDMIVVATDLTDTDFLVPHAVAQAKEYGARLTLVHAVAPLCVTTGEEAVIRYAEHAETMRQLRASLLTVAQRIEAEGIPCDAVVHTGSVSEVICGELSNRDATRLIMGTHGRGKLGQLAMGSVAHELVTTVEAPVFVVGPHARQSPEHVTPHRLLHPVSFEGNFQESFQLALDIARKYRAELTVLHVLSRETIESMAKPELAVEWALNSLDRLVCEARKLCPQIHTWVRKGKLAEQILKASVCIGANWMVLSAPAEPRHWPFRESAAFQILAAAGCPVLTLHHETYRKTAELEKEESLSAG
jgi:nucleotide-binding universal stress UspA family protein